MLNLFKKKGTKRNKMKVLFICKNLINTYGASIGLVNSAEYVSMYLNEQDGVESEVVVVTDGNDIDRVVTRHNPDYVFIQAIWVTSTKFKELLNIPRHKRRQWIVRIHSKLPFLANEGIAFKYINDYYDVMRQYNNFHLAPNSEEFANDLKSIYGRGLYLPNVYVKSFDDTKHHHKHEYTMDIGCFGALRPLKNQLIQAVAAIEFANKKHKRLHFHINSNRQEQHGDQVLKNIRNLFNSDVNCEHRLIEHKWMSHSDFIEVIKRMDVGLQVSLSESFNLVTADFISCKVPIIVSPDVTWMTPMYMADPNSTRSIVSKLHLCYDHYIPYLNELSLYFTNKDAKKEWNNFLDI